MPLIVSLQPRSVHLPTLGLLTWATHAIWMPSSSHCWGWTLLQRISWTTDLWRAYTVNHCAGIPAFSTACGVRIEDCEGWLLFSCHALVAGHWQLNPGVLGSIPSDCQLFVFLSFAWKHLNLCFQCEARSLNHYQHCLKQSYPLLCIMYYVAWNVPLQYVLCNHVLLHTLSRMMFLLLKSKRAKDSYESQRVLLKKIKGVISSRAAKFSGYRQQVSSQLPAFHNCTPCSKYGNHTCGSPM